MAKAFHILGLVVGTILGLLFMAMGCVWILQGFGIAFLDSFMANDLTWARNGALLAITGLAQVVWIHTRKGYYLRR